MSAVSLACSQQHWHMENLGLNHGRFQSDTI